MFFCVSFNANSQPEYIGQLEGEVAAKAQEADDLRVQNRKLVEENTRLTDLTRMLLSSQAFSGFLNELSASGVPTPSPNDNASQAQAKPKQTRKDINPHEAMRQANQHKPRVATATVSKTPTDFSMLEITSNTWDTPHNMNDFQVFSVTEMPNWPAIDCGYLSGKKSNFVETECPFDAVKDIPIIQSSPRISASATPAVIIDTPDESVDLDEIIFALFFDNGVRSLPVSSAGIDISFDTPLIWKESQPVHLVVGNADNSDMEILAISRLTSLCAALNATGERLAAWTSHL